MKVIFNEETKRFGFIFDRFRSIGDSLPFDSVNEFAEYSLFLVTYKYLGGINNNGIAKNWIKSSPLNDGYNWDKFNRNNRKIIATYGTVDADQALCTIIINTILPDFNNSLQKLFYSVYKRPDEFMKIVVKNYDKICDRPMKELTRNIGAGISGIALPGGLLNNSEGSVVKRIPGGLDNITTAFYDFCMEHKGIPFLPRIHGYGDDWVEMEKLSIGTRRCCQFSQELMQAQKDWSENNEKAKKKEPKYIKECIEVLNAMCRYTGIPDFTFLDIHEGNLGERSDGSIVIFDPIGPIAGRSTAKMNHRYVGKIHRLFKTK